MTRLLLLLLLSLPATAANLTDSLSKGTPMPKSVGAMAFGPDGVLFVADAKGMEVFAIATGDVAGKPQAVTIDGLDTKIAAMLGGKAPAANVISDMKVNLASGTVYLSVNWNGMPIILKATADGKLSEFRLKDVAFSKVAVKAKESSARAESITGLAYHNGRLFVAALPTEEFASNLRTFSVPFEKGADGITTEIFHGAHGKYETASPVQSLMALDIAGKTHILAGYTCTPLVKFPVDDVKGGSKLRGTTVAELGNMNKPLDMIAYTKDGKEFLLVANTARGVMKVSTEGIDKADGITSKVAKTAGLGYETVASLKGVMQLDKLDDTHAVIVTKNESGWALSTIDLP